MKPDEGKGEDEGDDEAAGKSRRRKPKTKAKSTTETRRRNGISWVACRGEYLRLCAYQRHREARNNAG